MRKKESCKKDKESDPSKCPIFTCTYFSREIFSTFFDEAKPCILHGRNVRLRRFTHVSHKFSPGRWIYRQGTNLYSYRNKRSRHRGGGNERWNNFSSVIKISREIFLHTLNESSISINQDFVHFKSKSVRNKV